MKLDMSAAKSPPTWTLSGFHGRVRTSKKFNLFIVTEGTEGDSYFYDRIAKSSTDPLVQAVKIFPVAQITRKEFGENSKGNPGKDSVIRAYEATKNLHAFSYGHELNKKSIMFCVDRDFTDTHAPFENEEHFVVTQQRDVEAEIIHNADPVLAIQHLVSKDSVDETKIVNTLGDWRIDLAKRWKDWLVLSMVAINLPSAPPGVSWSDSSLINENIYGKVEADKKLFFESKLIEKLGSRNQLEIKKREARARISMITSAHGRSSLVKGKWYPKYFGYMLPNICETKTSRIQANCLIAFISALKYEANWSQYYKSKFEASFSSCDLTPKAELKSQLI